MKVSIVSLGCEKNLVDSESLAYLFKTNDFELTNNIQEADVILVNTCGFIVSAKKESIDTILELAKEDKFLIVTGCLVTRYIDQLKNELPEVDMFVPIDKYPSFADEFASLYQKKKMKGQFSYNNRVLSTPSFTAYLKIAEGCSNCCSYCAIPLIRGPMHSFKKEDLLYQAKQIASQGVKELVIIAQDTTKYGIDLENYNIVSLLKDLLKIPEFAYIRLLYLYPDEISDELIDLIASEPRLTPYFDVPIQHSSSRLLKSMNRRGDRDFLLNLFKKIRSKVPNAILRTTLIIGFPGETSDDILDLEEFLKEVRFDQLGAFTYSREEDTKSYSLKPQISEKEKKRRLDQIMRLQQSIAADNNKKRIGTISKGLVIGYSEERNAYLLRSEWNAPEGIDGNIYYYSSKEYSLGDIVSFKIISSEIYDLIATEWDE